MKLDDILILFLEILIYLSNDVYLLVVYEYNGFSLFKFKNNFLFCCGYCKCNSINHFSLHLTLDMTIYHCIYFNVTLLDVPLSFIYFSLITHRLSLESTDRLERRHGEKRNFVVFPVSNDQVSTLSETFSFNREQIFGKCRQKSESSAREHFILGKTKRKRNDRKSNRNGKRTNHRKPSLHRGLQKKTESIWTERETIEHVRSVLN